MTIEQLFGHTGSNVSEDHFEKVFGGLFEGVMGGLENECRVVQSAVAAMTVEVMTGTFVTGGVFARVSAQDVLTITANVSGNPRIDRVVCRRDNATDTVTVYVLAGTPAGAPVPPTLTRAGGIYEISLAQVYVANGAASIDRSSIADERRSRSVCGLISPNGSPDARFPLVNNPGQVGGAGGSTGAGPDIAGWGLLDYITMVGTGGSADGIEADGLYVERISGAVVGNEAGWNSADSPVARTLNPELLMKFRLSAVTTSQRVFVGVGSATLATMVGADAPAQSYVGLQYSTGRGDTTWQFVSDSAGAGQVISDSEVPITITARSVRITCNDAADEWQIDLMDEDDNILAGRLFSAADNTPGEFILLYVVMGLETRTTAGRGFRHYSCHIVERST